MKVAVYTIALNEAQFVERWYESAKEADMLLIADTGSTDNTAELAESLGIEVTHIRVTPWRFEDARNAALSAIPPSIDMCIALDMDEVLMPGWKVALDAVKPETTRPRYKYTWSWNEDGSPGLQYGGDKIHTRKNYRWKHPVHEVLVPYGIDEVQEWIDLEIHHHPDSTKSRGQYLPLLAMSVKEDPHDCRNAYYYGRELFYNGDYPSSTEELKRYLALPTATWGAERAAAWRLLAKMNPDNAVEYLTHAINDAPEMREGYVDLAELFHRTQIWDRCLAAAESALKITEKPLAYLNESWAWGFLPYDFAAVSAYYLHFYDKALEYGKKALELAPEDVRLAGNLKFYEEAVKA